MKLTGSFGPIENDGSAAARHMTRSAQWLYGWLLLLPAAVLLALFTHYPAIATLWRGGVVWRDTFYPLEELRKGMV